MEYNWNDVDWRRANNELKTLQAKLYKAIRDQASKEEVRRIHNAIIQSFAARALAVRRITTNGGRKTAGIDGILYTTAEQKIQAVIELGNFNAGKYRANPVKRVLIPKGNGDTRPLGIPTIRDRSIQMLYNFILDVHQEHGANARSFGFRKGRSAKQAIQYAWVLSSGSKRWIMSVDVKKAYDRVNHEWILKNMPIDSRVVRQWLKAGAVDNGKTVFSDFGVPQGGPISPTIFNIVMNGIEDEILGADKKVFPLRYADDITVFGNDADSVEKMKEVIEAFLKPRGLHLNEEKTRIVEINDRNGIDLLGYNIREYHDPSRVGRPGRPFKQGILLIKPSKIAIRRLKLNIKNVLREHRNGSAFLLINKLNPIILGWANYFNGGGGWTKAKNMLGRWLWIMLKKWVYTKHKRLGRREALGLYFKGKQRRMNYYNKWTFFATKNGTEIYLTDIQEILVHNENILPFYPSPNPYNPEDYDKVDASLKRQARNDQRLNKLKRRLLKLQESICPLCGTIIILDEEAVERDHIIPRSEGGADTLKNTALVHKVCHNKKTAMDRKWAQWNKKKRPNEKLEANAPM